MRRSRIGEIQDRFWQRVDKRGPDDCWPWTGTPDGYGYGVIQGLLFGKVPNEGRRLLAHRASWLIHNGGSFPEGPPPGPHGWVVMHTCDNRACVNPAHLVLGSQRANVEDMHSKGRENLAGLGPRRGASHRRAVLTVEQAQYIASSSKTNPELAAELGVHKYTIKQVRCGRSNYLDEVINKRLREAAKGRKGYGLAGVKSVGAKLTMVQVRYVRASPLKNYEIAAELGVSAFLIGRIRRCESYKE